MYDVWGRRLSYFKTPLFNDYGISFEHNPRFRQTMEDEHVAITPFGGSDCQAFFGVYDGHGGRQIASYVASNLHKNILEELEKRELSPLAPVEKIDEGELEVWEETFQSF